jgi:putative ABC transport system permease protein
MSIWMDGLARDLKHAARSLARTPGFTVTVVLTLALGIGANTAVFSAIDAVLLRPLPFPDADRLVQLQQVRGTSAATNIAPLRLEDWNRLNVTFDGITGYYMEDVSETSGEFPERVRRAFVTQRFSEVWRVEPAIGRGFTADNFRTGGSPAVLISDRYWRVRLGAAPDVIGKTIRTDSTSSPIVGVMPARFRFPDREVDLWFPSAVDFKFAQTRQATWFLGVGRLKPGVTLDHARANLDAVQAQLGQEFPDTDRDLRVTMVPLKEITVGSVRGSLWLLFGGVSVLLLITCTNVAGLLLARTRRRHHEIAVRLSLGASRLAVAAQLVIESVLLSVVGAALGLPIAAGAVAALQSGTTTLPRIDEIAIDWRIVLYTVISALVVAVACGILPALRAGRDQASGMLTEGGRTQVSSRGAVQWMLVGAQVALSVMLLAGAGLLVRSFQELSRVDAGFDTSRVLTFRISGNFGETANYDRLIARIDGTIEALRGLPGVDAAATAIFLPGVPAQYETPFALAEAGSDPDQRFVAASRYVSPEYFSTMKIPLLAGNPCQRRARGSQVDVMVNAQFAARYLASRSSVVGLRLIDGGANKQERIITGVVGDAREAGMDREPPPTVYSCFSTPNPTPYFLVRTRTEPQDLAQTVRLMIKARDPLRSVYDIAPLEDRIGGAFAQNRLRTVLLGLFAVTALALASVGLYGTLSYIVSLRRREIGLRLALGALRGEIVRQFLMQALRVVGGACVLGLLMSLGFTRLLTGMLYGVSPADPVVLALVIGLVLVVSTLAALVPATRAAVVEPMHVLREG